MHESKSITKRKFTRTPKIAELIECGVPLRTLPTYHALSDHACNKTGRTFVSVDAIAGILKVCRRTVERHLSALERAGVIKRQHQRRTGRGRFSSCLCVVISFALFSSATVRHPVRSASRREKNHRTKPLRNHPPTPQGGTEEAREERERSRRAQEIEKFGRVMS